MQRLWNAIVKLGKETLEVSSFGDYILNGVSNTVMPNVLSGFTVTHDHPSEHVHVFEIYLGSGESIVVSTLKDMVSVKLDKLDAKRFQDSVGMLGDYQTGQMLGRDGVTVFDDPNEFAAEWQVRDDEPMLFLTADYPQYTQKCVLPDTVVDDDKSHNKKGGVVRGDAVSMEAAKVACAGWKPDEQDGCIHDGKWTRRICDHFSHCDCQCASHLTR